jgi:hypothetical protein
MTRPKRSLKQDVVFTVLVFGFITIFYILVDTLIAPMGSLQVFGTIMVLVSPLTNLVYRQRPWAMVIMAIVGLTLVFAGTP